MITARSPLKSWGTTLLFLISVSGVLEGSTDDKMLTSPLRQVTVRLSEYRFDPSEIVLKAGEEVELTLVNQGTVLHEFIAEALQDVPVDVAVNGVVVGAVGLAELELAPKAKAVLLFTPEKAGEFPFSCRARDPKDHFKEGMVGKLVVR